MLPHQGDSVMNVFDSVWTLNAPSAALTSMSCFPQIISQYSVVVLLEVMDKSGKAMNKLLQELNNPR